MGNRIFLKVAYCLPIKAMRCNFFTAHVGKIYRFRYHIFRGLRKSPQKKALDIHKLDNYTGKMEEMGVNLLFDQYIIKEHYEKNVDAALLEGDAFDILKQLPDNTFKLIVSSPPYNIGKFYEQEVGLQEYLDWQEKIIIELYRTCHINGSIVWQVGNYVDQGEIFPLDIYFYPLFKKLGLKLRNRIIWHFGHGLHASKRFSGRYEVLLWFTKSDEYTFNLDEVRIPSKYPGKRNYKGNNIGKPSGNPLGKNPSDYWEIIAGEWDDGIIDIPNVKSNHPEKTEHPCSFPIELIERCVLAFTNENDCVLDPFGGAGSSLIAALKQKRRGVVIDKEKKYLNITKERIAKLADGSLKMRKIGTPIFEPTGKEKVSQIPLEWINNNVESVTEKNLYLNIIKKSLTK